MMRPSEREWLLQADVRSGIVLCGQEPWVLAYRSFREGNENGAMFSAVIPQAQIAEALQGDSWDLRVGDGLPGCSQRFLEGQPQTTYHRFGDSSGVEPLVFVRDFHGLKPKYIELIEEFRHVHNLYHDRATDKYVRFDGMGNEELVAEVEPDGCRILLRPLRQFLALKDACLAVYFDVVRFSTISFDAIPEAEREVVVQDRDLVYTLRVAECDWMRDRGFRSFSRLLGKKIIPPPPREECGIWPYDARPDKFEKFIIGVDAAARAVEHTCDPDTLANYFGKNPDAPHFLTPVFFRREVFTKYYGQPDKYTVQDGYLFCGGLWGLRLDNNHDDHVIVFLGDLGETLSYEEQLYWRSFNVEPQGTISRVAFNRGFLAEATDPESPDLYFKLSFDRFQEAWATRWKWALFLPLASEDFHHLKSLRVPLTNDQKEFDEQVLSLTKILIDSLNEAALKAALPGVTFEPGERGITKLERFLAGNGYTDDESDVRFLRDLQQLRSTGSAHRKGGEYQKVTARLGLQDGRLAHGFERMLQRASRLLSNLGSQLIGPPASSSAGSR